MSPRNTPRSQGLGRALEAEVRRLGAEERRARWRARWCGLRAFWGRLEARAKRWAAVGAIVSMVGKPAWKLAIKVRALYRARSVAPAELPKTGTPTTALDFVPEPKPDATQSSGEPGSSQKPK